jgi:hypothetical protein
VPDQKVETANFLRTPEDFETKVERRSRLNGSLTKWSDLAQMLDTSQSQSMMTLTASQHFSWTRPNCTRMADMDEDNGSLFDFIDAIRDRGEKVLAMMHRFWPQTKRLSLMSTWRFEMTLDSITNFCQQCGEIDWCRSAATKGVWLNWARWVS